MTRQSNPLRGLRGRLILQTLGRLRTWINIGLCAAVLALILLATVRVPASVTHELVRIERVGLAETYFGSRPVYQARRGDGRMLNDVRSAQNEPRAIFAPGDLVCLRIQTDRFTGRITGRVTAPARCEG